MLSKNFAIVVVVVLACVCLAEAREESPHDMADALRMLQELDRYYTQAARPRFGKRSDAFTNWAKDLEVIVSNDMPSFVAKQLHRLPPVTFDHVNVTRLLKDVMFLKKSLTEVQTKLEKPDIPAWLQYARRR